MSGLLTLSATDRFIPASGMTAQRPAFPAEMDTRYNTTLHALEYFDSGAWRPHGAQSIAAGFKNLVIVNNPGTPNSKIDLSADAVTVETASGIAYRLTSVSKTIDCTVLDADAQRARPEH